MKYLIILLTLISSLSFAESGLKLHGLNLGFGGEGVTATGLGVAFNNIYLDHFLLPHDVAITTLSYSTNFEFGIFTFGSYSGVTDNQDSSEYFAHYNLGDQYSAYFQPYVRLGRELYIEASALKNGAKVSFLILAR